MLIQAKHLNLAQIADSGQCFRWERLGDGAYRIPAFGRLLKIRQRSGDTVEADCEEAAWREVWQGYFDLDTDYDAMLKRIPRQDAYLAAAAAHGAGIRILRQPLWETMASFLISQNNNIPRIRGIIDRLCEGKTDFPGPERIAALGEERLREDGLGYRAPYLMEAAARYLAEDAAGRLSQMDYASARAYLMRYRGIGEKVADCVCLYGLHHLRAFPMDKWMKQIAKNRYGGRFPMESYADMAGVMQQYMFAYERFLSGVTHPLPEAAEALG